MCTKVSWVSISSMKLHCVTWSNALMQYSPQLGPSRGRDSGSGRIDIIQDHDWVLVVVVYPQLGRIMASCNTRPQPNPNHRLFNGTLYVVV